MSLNKDYKENKVELELQQIEEYLRNNEIARLVVLRAMKLESGIWVRNCWEIS